MNELILKINSVEKMTMALVLGIIAGRIHSGHIKGNKKVDNEIGKASETEYEWEFKIKA